MNKTAKTGTDPQVTTPDLFVLLADICRQLDNHPHPQADQFVAQTLKLLGDALKQPQAPMELWVEEIHKLILKKSEESDEAILGKNEEISKKNEETSGRESSRIEEIKKDELMESKEIVGGFEEIKGFGVRKIKEKILALLEENPALSIRELAESLDVSPSGVEKKLRELKSSGNLRRIGPMRGRGGRWEIVRQPVEARDSQPEEPVEAAAEVSAPEVAAVDPAPVQETPSAVSPPAAVPPATSEVASLLGEPPAANPEMLIHQVMTAYNASQQAYIDAWKRRDPNAKILLQRQKQLGDQVSRLQAADLQKLSAQFQAQSLQFQETNAQLEQSLADLQRLSKRANRIVDVAAKIDQIILLVAKVVK